MRCDEVIRELAAPAADRDGRAMAEHLAGCPACAEWARRAEALDRLWEATRPVEPTAEAWDAVWSRITPTLPAGSGPREAVRPRVLAADGPGHRSSRGGRRVLAVVLVGLAQAAAILIALGLAWRTPDVREAARPDVAVAEADGGPADDATPHAIRSPGRVDFTAEFDASCVMVIHLDRTSGRVEEITPPEMNVGSDIGMVITNEMEGIATPRVAAQ